MWGKPSPPRLQLGRTKGFFGGTPVGLSRTDSKTHAHVIGVSGSGKSRFLAGLYLELLAQGLPATLLDPHGELAELVLAALVARGWFQRPDAYDRLLYLNLPAAERAGQFLPFNILAGHPDPHTAAGVIKDAFHRAYPELAHGAPMFDTLAQDGIKVLMSNELPVTALYRLLTDTGFRDDLLRREDDPDIVAFFHDQFDRLSLRDQADQAGAALRRAHLLTFAPVLKFSLGQRGLVLDWPAILAAGTSCIINLKVANNEASRLLGCLMTVLAEHAALNRRGDTPSHHLIIDEFANFTEQSGEALAHMLSQTRKNGLFVVMAHQDWSQVSDPKLRGAMGGVGMEVVFRVDREDARYTAPKLFRVDPRTVRQDVTRDESETAGMAEQWERYVQALQDLPPRHAYMRLPQRPTQLVRTLPLPNPVVSAAAIAAVEATYLQRYFRPKAAIVQEQLAYQAAPAAPQPKTERAVRIGK